MAIGATGREDLDPMGFLGDAVGKAKDLADQHDEKVDDAIERAGNVVDDKTGDKHVGHVDQAQDLLQDKTGAGDTHR